MNRGAIIGRGFLRHCLAGPGASPILRASNPVPAAAGTRAVSDTRQVGGETGRERTRQLTNSPGNCSAGFRCDHPLNSSAGSDAGAYALRSTMRRRHAGCLCRHHRARQRPRLRRARRGSRGGCFRRANGRRCETLTAGRARNAPRRMRRMARSPRCSAGAETTMRQPDGPIRGCAGALTPTSHGMDYGAGLSLRR